MMKIASLIVCAIVTATGYAQQTLSVNNVAGTCVIANISPEKAKETALFNAKIEALRQAGIPENVLAEVTQMGEIFLETSNIEVGGGVTGYEIVSDDVKVIREGRATVMVAEVVINATVMKYSRERDPSFQLQVDGIKSAYREKETLSFSVTPHQNGYLRIFLFEEDGSGSQIYPDSKIEPDMLFSQNGTIKFPLNSLYYYVLEKTDKTKSKEINRILFLFLKDNIRFADRYITLQSVTNWKSNISPDRRTQVFREFVIER
ncbi:MAG: DUF4384 domain-containing protein [Tannerellaceae bacterium]|jgi:hypothetical protein|nr:DUF4384 domain-containing protein [Tannerellaceae bacterium]